jgi:hypothetical protein
MTNHVSTLSRVRTSGIILPLHYVSLWCVVFSLSLTLSLCQSVQEGKDGSSSASYCYFPLRRPGMFWIVTNLLSVLFVKYF